MTAKKSFRNSAAFGKRIEYWIIGRMLKEGLDGTEVTDKDQITDLISRLAPLQEFPESF